MITPTVTSRSELLAATGEHPFIALYSDERLSAYQQDEAWVWVSQGPWGPLTAGLGEPAAVLALPAELYGAGLTVGRRLRRVARTSFDV